MLLVCVCVFVAGKRCSMKLNNSGKNFGAKCLLKVTRTATVVDKYLYYFAFSFLRCLCVCVYFISPFFVHLLTLSMLYTVYMPLHLFYYYFLLFSVHFKWIGWHGRVIFEHQPNHFASQPIAKNFVCLPVHVCSMYCAVLLLLLLCTLHVLSVHTFFHLIVKIDLSSTNAYFEFSSKFIVFLKVLHVNLYTLRVPKMSFAPT